MNTIKYLLALSLLLSGCATTQSSGTNTIVESVKVRICSYFSTITFDGKLDTAETIEQILTHNAKYDGLCKDGQT